MNLSQLCHIFQFNRPAARHTREDRVSCTIPSRSGGRFAPVTPAGFTLVEVLVAMVILLVGIWTLAVGFPKLLGVVGTQEKRTEMARQAERTLNQLTRYPNNLPLAIRGDSLLLYDADLTRGPADIDATGQPEDPTISAPVTSDNANARDDMIEVIGERFTVPAPPPGGLATPVYAFRQGLATPGTVVVYNEQPLPGGFGVAPNGTVNFGGALLVEINYDWVDTGGETHHVYRELIGPPDPIAAQSMATFAQVLPGYDGMRLVQLAVLPGGPSVPGQVVEDPSGAFLLFDESAVGARMRISYVLLTDPARNDRRALIMSEEHRIVSLPQTITLVAGHIDETPLPVDLGGPASSILAVDVGNGGLYWEGNGLQLADPAKGEVMLPSGSAAASAIGSDLRFYYVTLDQDMISVQIAPATFADANVALAGDLYRSYSRYDYIDIWGDPKTDLVFYPCNAGHTVTVDYKWDNGSTTITINGEMHTISTESYPAGHLYEGYHHITLRPSVAPGVQEIIAVEGKSLQAIAWWRTPNGRLERLEISTVR